MPEPLVTATRDKVDGLLEEHDWRERLEARRAFELRPKANPEPDGSQCFLCPAAGGGRRVCCPRKPASMGDPTRITLDPAPEPTGPPIVCNQQSTTMPAEAGAKHGQARPYGTPEWESPYRTLRSSIEGFNGYAKDPTAANLENARGRRVRGIAAQHLVLAFQLAIVNLRKLDRWRDRTR